MTAIPASAIVNVIPGVLAAGGSALNLNGLLLTSSARVPIGSVVTFASEVDVAAYFGAGSAEDLWATKYFLGFDNSQKKPGALLMAQYPSGSVAAYVRGGRVSGLTLTQLKAITGTFTVTIDGVAKNIAAVDLSAATSFSDAASKLQTQLSGGAGVTVTYDTIAGAFVITSGTTGASSTMTYGSGTASTALGLTQAAGAVTSQGAIAGVPGTAMTAIANQTQAWATFTTLTEPSAADGLLFGEWSNGKANRFLYVAQETDVAATIVPDTTTVAALCKAENLTGVLPVWEASSAYNTAAVIMGSIAAIDFAATNGRTTIAFRSQSGESASVFTQSDQDSLIANGYNFYGAYASAANNWSFLYPGSVLGPFLWADTFVNQIWLNDALQVALMTLLTSQGSVPYNAAGYALIEAACADPINAALNFGAIRAGVSLSALQKAEVNADAGLNIADTIQARGWYLQVQDASAGVRAARGSPPCTFWYTDGQSVQQITLGSVEIQ